MKRRTSNGGVKGGGDERGGPHTEPGPGSQPPEASREVQGSGGGGKPSAASGHTEAATNEVSQDAGGTRLRGREGRRPLKGRAMPGMGRPSPKHASQRKTAPTAPNPDGT